MSVAPRESHLRTLVTPKIWENLEKSGDMREEGVLKTVKTSDVIYGWSNCISNIFFTFIFQGHHV